jgi:hypothetical protein
VDTHHPYLSLLGTLALARTSKTAVDRCQLDARRRSSSILTDGLLPPRDRIGSGGLATVPIMCLFGRVFPTNATAAGSSPSIVKEHLASMTRSFL